MVQVGGGIPPALAAARKLVRNELTAPAELIQVRRVGGCCDRGQERLTAAAQEWMWALL